MDAYFGGACALGSAAIWAYSATYITEPARVYGGRATNLFKSVVGAVLFLATVLVWLGPEALARPWAVYAGFVASGLAGLAVADTAYLNALRFIGPTLTAITYQTSGIFTCLLGAVLLRERLEAVEYAGIALVIGGVALAVIEDRADDPARISRRDRVPGTIYALIAAAFHAIGLVANKHAYDALAAHDGTRGEAAAIFGGFARMAAAAVAVFLAGLTSRSWTRYTLPLRERRGWRLAFFPAFFGTFVAMITMQLALTRLKSGPASVLLSMTPIFTMPVAWRALGHRPSARSVLGAVVALAGAVLLARER